MADANLTVTVDGVTLNLFMSYGLLTALSRLVPNPDNVSKVGLDPDLRDKCLEEALASRSPVGESLEVPSLKSLSLDDANSILEWMQEHLLAFFLRQIKTANRLVTAAETSLMSSTDGSQS